MKPAILSAILLAFWIGPACCATADEPANVNRPSFPGSTLACPDALLRRCCDIYCPKPFPCLPCFHQGCGAYGFCTKPCPCVPGYCASCTTYGYCRKPCPDLCRPLDAHYFTCVNKRAACADSSAFGGSTIVPASALQATEGDNTGNGAGSAASTSFLSD